jgi:hypothetical protein
VARGVAALAASLRLPTLGTAQAAQLAEAERLVTHLTSLVLVDENGATQESVPASRKVPLATPARQLNVMRRRSSMARMACEFDVRAAAPVGVAFPASAPPPPAQISSGKRDARSRALEQVRLQEETSRQRSEARGLSRAAPIERSRSRLRGLMSWFRRDMLERSGEDLSRIARNMNWDFAPDRLQGGDLRGLGSSVQEAIRKAAAKSDVIALASKLGLHPIVLVIGLMAHAVAQHNRSARRLARAMLPNTFTDEQKAVARGLGLG